MCIHMYFDFMLSGLMMFDGRWHRGRPVQRLMLCIRGQGAGLLEVWDRARASVRAEACAVHQSKYRILMY